ncbi:TetR/AcrR family transcriptional regulator [Mucilaginibacter sp. OK283]|uniref:TetR/AcrR family transcriptional regulator n=1 Tax=Mucilaginibacter sp. OK283 TaxID=1881049 RepID=UPI0008D03505|nr:TetR/AcrR family transcriptional regulator [Mucilaginibacter sp. OK283]SEP40452.1 transcriptional regulator, TetR family [Mucilaginibacter sp. OK283]
MEILATETEQLIKDTAKKVFFVDGNIHATTQDIADAAGINRASIHYYYRSRKKLLDTVLQEAMIEMQTKIQSISEQAITFREQTEKFIEFFLERSLQHPYLEMFIITELNANPELAALALNKEEREARVKDVTEGIEGEVKAGAMKPIHPAQFMITLISLCSFPFLGQTLLRHILSMDKETYVKFIMERKNVIMKLIFLDA